MDRRASIHIDYSREVTGFAQDEEGVDVRLVDGDTRAEYLVGCDGGRSLIRKLAGIEFPGWEPSKSSLIAEVEVTEETPKGIRHDEIGVHGLHVMEDGKTFRVVTSEREIGPDSEPTLDDLKAALGAAYGTDFGAHNPTWISRFTDMTRQAASTERVACCWPGMRRTSTIRPAGRASAWARRTRSTSAGSSRRSSAEFPRMTLLDSYQAERHPSRRGRCATRWP